MDEHGWKSPAAGTTPDLRAQDEASGRTSIGSGEPEDCPAAAVSGVSAATANPAVQMTVARFIGHILVRTDTRGQVDGSIHLSRSGRRVRIVAWE
jgi:hypothetical protein